MGRLRHAVRHRRLAATPGRTSVIDTLQSDVAGALCPQSPQQASRNLPHQPPSHSPNTNTRHQRVNRDQQSEQRHSTNVLPSRKRRRVSLHP